MCGLFGLVRNPNAEHPEWATAVLAELGNKATTRGRDSSGVAYIPMETYASSLPSQKMHAESRFIQVGGGTTINKDTKTFAEVWQDSRDIELANWSAAIVGHTRTATKGSTRDLKNVSPLAVGTVIATHNGDIDENTVKKWLPKDSKNHGSTDTETLFRAISNVRSHRKKVTDILTATRGRVGIAWYDRRLPGRIFIARGGMAPVAIAFDNEGNLYWASNPQWFRDIDDKFDGTIGFHSIVMIPEGRLITLRFSNTDAPVVDDLREFVPTVRRSDTLLPDRILWRDFTKEDQEADKKSFIHKVYESKINTAPKTSYKQTVPHPSQYEWDDIPDYHEHDRFTHNGDAWSNEPFGGGIDPYETMDASFGIDWLNDKGSSDYLIDSIDSLEACTDEEGAEAVSEAYAYLQAETEGRIGGSYVRRTLQKAMQNDDFEGVVKDYGFTNIAVARAFTELVLSASD